MFLRVLAASLIVALAGLVIPGRPAAAAVDPAADRQHLNDELLRLGSAKPDASPLVPDGRSIHPGERNPALAQVRAALARYGFATPVADQPDFYDDATIAVVRQFQDEVGLVPDGVIGLGTRRALRHMDRDPALMVEQSLQQTGLPAHGRYLLVNVAAGLVTAVDNGRIAMTSRAVVGRRDDDTETPVFSAHISAVWLNPQWVVPDSIALKEFGGQAHIEKPGPNNPLGAFLLEMPNEHAVFLHSTNEPRLFGMDLRAFSHGCVRVQEIEALARWLLGERRWADEDVDGTVARLISRRLVLDQPVPVYIQYRTATVASTGSVIYHPDPYRLAEPPPDPAAASILSSAAGASPASGVVPASASGTAAATPSDKAIPRRAVPD